MSRDEYSTKPNKESIKVHQNLASYRTKYLKGDSLGFFLTHPVPWVIRQISGFWGGVLNQRERERGNRGEYKSQSGIENTKMTECTQEIGYLQSINSQCVELEKMPLITFRSKYLGDNDRSVVICISLNSL
jgi:hypothetical protein